MRTNSNQYILLIILLLVHNNNILHMKERITLSFDPTTVSKIDSIRGLVPRSRFMEHRILRSLNSQNPLTEEKKEVSVNV